MDSSATPTSPAAPLRTALVGLGRIGFQFHAPALRANPGFALTAVVDPLADRRSEAEALWSVHGYADVATMLAQEKPDVVVIASPTPWHAEQTCAALAAGAHVVCDKPMASSLAEFDRMAAAAQQSGRKLVAYQPHRISRRVRTMQAILASGKLGKIHLVRAVRHDYRRRADWQAFLAHGGGMLNNYTSHALDEVLAFFGVEPVASIHCATRRIATLGDAEDVVKAIITTQSGRLIDLDVSQACAMSSDRWQIDGAYGSAEWNHSEAHWQLRWFDPAQAPAGTAQSGQAATGRSYDFDTLPWRTEAASVPELPPFSYYDIVHAYFHDRGPAPVPLAESRHVIELIEGCRAAAAGGR